MMQSNQDLELLRDIPGYKAILKALIKSQIQHLVEQLSTHTEEEAVLLTASITDGSLSHLGSASGKVFLDKNEDIKSKFLGFCLKRHHQTQPTPETEPQNVYQNTSDSTPPVSQHSFPQKRQWSHYRNSTFPYQHSSRPRQFQLKNTANQSVPLSMATHLTSTVGSNNSQGEGHASQEHQVQVQGQTLESENVTIKSENQQGQSSDVGNLDSFHSTNTTLNVSSIDQSNHSSEMTSNENDASQLASVKIEAVTEEDLELEITGVEMAEGSQMNLDWSSMTDNSQAAASGQSYGSDQQLANHLHQAFPSTNHNARFQSSNHPINAFDTDSNSEVFPHGYTEMTVNRYHGDGMDAATSYICQLCDRRFKRNDYLQKHLRTHTGDKPYACKYCGTTFSQKQNMDRHVIIKHLALQLRNK